MKKYPRRKVKEIIDGDTFKVARAINGVQKIRLEDVDAPEIGTKAGKKAKKTLAGMIAGKTVTIRPKARSYDRVVAEVIADRKSVNKRMRKRGY